jgi:hypothetical protein
MKRVGGCERLSVSIRGGILECADERSQNDLCQRIVHGWQRIG